MVDAEQRRVGFQPARLVSIALISPQAVSDPLNVLRNRKTESKPLGKFFQARFKAVRLLDEQAVLACAAYVELNPTRAVNRLGSTGDHSSED